MSATLEAPVRTAVVEDHQDVPVRVAARIAQDPVAPVARATRSYLTGRQAPVPYLSGRMSPDPYLSGSRTLG